MDACVDLFMRKVKIPRFLEPACEMACGTVCEKKRVDREGLSFTSCPGDCGKNASNFVKPSLKVFDISHRRSETIVCVYKFFNEFDR